MEGNVLFPDLSVPDVPRIMLNLETKMLSPRLPLSEMWFVVTYFAIGPINMEHLPKSELASQWPPCLMESSRSGIWL
jgi:hypothetical protein